MYLAGSPAEVVTNLIPAFKTTSIMDSSFKKRSGKFTPKGLSVKSAIAMISFLQFSTSPEEVSTMPKPPAFETAEASLLLAIHPMGA